MEVGPMAHLTTVGGSFHARVVAARLGAEGILVELRGPVDGPYPDLGSVDVWVPEDQLGEAREVLLGDAVDAAFDSGALDGWDQGPHGEALGHRRSRGRLGLLAACALLAVLVAVAAVAVGAGV
jgi:hypothetical protein